MIAAFKANLKLSEVSAVKPGTVDPNATLIVLGNGPSLKDFDFERLRRFDCIGMNAAYRFWERINWYPRYYACFDVVVGLSHKDAILDLIRHSDKNGIELFFLRNNLIRALPSDQRASPKVVNFDTLLRGPLAGVAEDWITTGSHAAVVGALLGYGRLALLGIDCNYVEEVKGARHAGGYVLEMAETPGDNPNYFFADYQRSGDRYHLPNPGPNVHVLSWRKIAPFLKNWTVETWNCNSDSRVDAFRFRSFDEIEADSRSRDEQPRTLEVSQTVFFSPPSVRWYRRPAEVLKARNITFYTLLRFAARSGRKVVAKMLR